MNRHDEKRPSAATGEEAYLPHLDRLAIPITFSHGERNECFLPASTEKTYELLPQIKRQDSLPTSCDSRLRPYRLHLRQECREGCLSADPATFRRVDEMA